MTQLEIVRSTETIAAEINSIKEQTQRMLLINSIEIGRRLAEAKEMINHGEWGKWLQESVDYSQRTASNLINVFVEYGDSQLSLFGSEAKSQALANLSYTQAVALLGIPADEREEFVEENKIDEMSTRELQKAIKEKKEMEKRLKEQQEREQNYEKEKKELERKVQELDDNLFQLKQKEDKDPIYLKEIERLNKELKETEEKAKQLEKDLKDKPLEAETVEVQVVPEEVLKELQELRSKASVAEQAEIDSNEVKFKVHFESLVKVFNDTLSTVDEIKSDEAKLKYKGAINKLLDKMKNALN